MALVPYRDNGVYTTTRSTNSFPGYYPRRDRGYVERDMYKSPMDTYSRPRGFPFMAVRIIGGVLLVMSVLVFIIGIVAVALNVPKEEHDPFLMTFGAITMSIITVFALAAGIVGVLHSEYRTNLEGYRNSFLVLCWLTAVLSLIMWVMEAVYHDTIYGNDGLLQNLGPLTSESETNSAVWITMTVFTAILFLVALVGACIVCCMPALCAPVVDNDAYVYSYDRKMYDMDDVGFLGFLGFGGRGRRDYYNDEPRMYNSRDRFPARERYVDDYSPRYAQPSTRGRYY